MTFTLFGFIIRYIGSSENSGGEANVVTRSNFR